MLAATLAQRYGKSASKFVAQQVIESDEANRPTWLAVMDALSHHPKSEGVSMLNKVLEDNWFQSA